MNLKYVKQNTDIVKVIGHFVELKPNGANYIGRSPFNDEHTPSFTVSRAKGIFKCFSSGESGDVIDFVAKKRGITLVDAAQWISKFSNLNDQPNDWKFKPEPERPVSYISGRVLESSLKGSNNFRDWLGKGYDDYFIGSSKHWPGATVFWYVDVNRKIRSGKIMLYNVVTGKRVKEPFSHITWVHKVLNLPDFNFELCLFGEHLLQKYPDRRVMIVESEKTAIVCSLRYPNVIWLASGSLTNLNYKRCSVLLGRDITLCPDYGCELKWQAKVDEMAALIPGQWRISQLPGPQVKGFDLCDFIIDGK